MRDDYDAFLERRARQDLPGPVIGDWAQPPAGGGVGDDVSDRVNLKGEALRAARAKTAQPSDPSRAASGRGVARSAHW